MDKHEEKVLDTRLRHKARRLGLLLNKSRRRDPVMPDYGVYWIANAQGWLISPEQGTALEEVESWLDSYAEWLRDERHQHMKGTALEGRVWAD